MSQRLIDKEDSVPNCHKCGLPILLDADIIISVHNVWFHDKCYNQYEHYYGLDKPID